MHLMDRFRGFDNKMELGVGRLLFRRTTVQVHRVGQYQMVVDHRYGDSGSVRQCVSGNMYRDHIRRLQLPKKLATLDIGANAGGFPLLLATEGYELAALTCVEFNPFTYERLRFNIRTNFGLETDVIHAALTDRRESIECVCGKGSTGDSIFNRTLSDGKYTIRVQSMTLDDLVRTMLDRVQRVDLCKIDIEKAEEGVFLGSNYRFALDHIDTLIIEIHHARSSHEVCDAIVGTGMEWVSGSGQKGTHGVHLFSRIPQKLAA